jgi:hypothetical protein
VLYAHEQQPGVGNAFQDARPGAQQRERIKPVVDAAAPDQQPVVLADPRQYALGGGLAAVTW